METMEGETRIQQAGQVKVGASMIAVMTQQRRVVWRRRRVIVRMKLRLS
jgi:hypothetical protein